MGSLCSTHRGNIKDVNMSGEGDEVVMDVEEAAPAPAPVSETKMDTMTAVQEVLKNALYADGLARGLREAVRALDRKAAHFAVICTDTDKPEYQAIVQALCAEHSIPYINIDNAEKLGEWAGLCKIDAEGVAKKIVKCKCVAVTNWGREGQAVEVL